MSTAAMPFDPKGHSYTFFRQDLSGRDYEKLYLQEGRVYDSSYAQRTPDPEVLHRGGLAVTKEFRMECRKHELRSELQEKLELMRQEAQLEMDRYTAQMESEVRKMEAEEQAQYAAPMETVVPQELQTLGPKFNFELTPTPRLDKLIPIGGLKPPSSPAFLDVKVPAFGEGAVAVNNIRPATRLREADPVNTAGLLPV